MAISRAQMGSQLTGNRVKKTASGGFVSTGNDAQDLATLRAAKNIDDGGVSKMEKGGSTSRVNEAGQLHQANFAQAHIQFY
jgi:hypothetical protein